MNARKLLCVVSAVAMVASVSASAQSLPELAKLEKARRAKLRAASGAAKVYTEGNQSGTARTAAAAESAVPGDPEVADGAEANAGPKAKTPQEIEAEKQADWNERLAKAQAEIKSFEDAVTTNERALASMFNITPARADLVNRIEADKQKVVALKKTLTDLEDERRRSGLPRVR